jgi:protein gp37
LAELAPILPWPKNVWMGVSVESEDFTYRIRNLARTKARIRFASVEPLLGAIPDLPVKHLDWVVLGGESGPGARPLHIDWVRDLRDQCVRAKVPFFFKQWGGVNKALAGRELDGKTWSQFPPGVADTALTA